MRSLGVFIHFECMFCLFVCVCVFVCIYHTSLVDDNVCVCESANKAILKALAHSHDHI